MVFLKQNWARKTLVTIDVSEKTTFTKDVLQRSISADKEDGVRKWLVSPACGMAGASYFDFWADRKLNLLSPGLKWVCPCGMN